MGCCRGRPRNPVPAVATARAASGSSRVSALDQGERGGCIAQRRVDVQIEAAGLAEGGRPAGRQTADTDVDISQGRTPSGQDRAPTARPARDPALRDKVPAPCRPHRTASVQRRHRRDRDNGRLPRRAAAATRELAELFPPPPRHRHRRGSCRDRRRCWDRPRRRAGQARPLPGQLGQIGEQDVRWVKRKRTPKIER